MARVDMFKRIMDTMYDDAEVVEWCERQINRSSNSKNATAAKMELAEQIIKFYTDPAEPVCARDFAAKVNSNGGYNWNTRTASWYLNALAKDGIAEKVIEKGQSNRYFYVGKA